MYHQIGLNCIWNNGKDLTVVEEKDLSNEAEDIEARKRRETMDKITVKVL